MYIIRRIKEEHSIKCRRHKRFKITTDSNQNKLVYPNVLEQQFDASRPNQAWVDDITYIWTHEGWLYLAGVKDLYTKELVGYAINKRMTAYLVCHALNMAINNKRPSKGLIFHSDRDSQYCSYAYQNPIEQHQFTGSLSGKGNHYGHSPSPCTWVSVSQTLTPPRSFDNAPIESFCGVLKNELVYHQDCQTRFETVSDITKYIDLYYNEERSAKHCFAVTQDKRYVCSGTRIQMYEFDGKGYCQTTIQICKFTLYK